ncbi:DUF6153 family protein [Nocardioides sp.]|uniref:DUF6153 family protein n=1 Tax=Nocardioides sp. TaxID=35761 RepID=UPI001DCB475D|nr:DUF6153 family protein [Nocardioides sp.]MBU1800702.1 hypothetical protein [Actinomycetota bacterium]
MRSKRRPRTLACWLLALLSVFAVFAMHVLAATPAAAGPGSGTHAAHGAPVAVDTAAAGDDVLPTSGDGGGGHAGVHGGLGGICLAVLSALLLLFAAGRPGRGWPAARLSGLGQCPVAPRRDLRGPAPPDLHVLCIARC